MKVLFIGVYRDGTGWGHAATEYILALDAAGVDVVPRSIQLASARPNYKVPERIAELEKKSLTGCDVVIQFVLPEHMDYDGHFDKNIGIYTTETSHFKRSGWAERLNLMDEAWVMNEDMVGAAYNSNVDIPLATVGLPCDPSKYMMQYEPYKLPGIDGKFVFYTIGEVNRRKNLVALLKAFHLEFHPSEPVELVIKGSVPGESPMDCNRHLTTIINKVKTELKLYTRISDYHDEILVVNELSDEEIMRLHATCDCFVSPSYGEAWSIPTFDAMAMGKTPIATHCGGPKEFLQMAGVLIPYHTEPVFGMNTNNMPNIYCGDEDWYSIDIGELRKAMRRIYEDTKYREELSMNGIDRAYDYSYKKIGNYMKGLLDGTRKAAFFNRTSEVREKHDCSKLVEGTRSN